MTAVANMTEDEKDALCQSVMKNGADRKTLDSFRDMGADCVAAMRRDPTVSLSFFSSFFSSIYLCVKKWERGEKWHLAGLAFYNKSRDIPPTELAFLIWPPGGRALVRGQSCMPSIPDSGPGP